LGLKEVRPNQPISSEQEMFGSKGEPNDIQKREGEKGQERGSGGS